MVAMLSWFVPMAIGQKCVCVCRELPNDQISHYIKATPMTVPAYEAAKLASEFDPQDCDENVDYYVAKLDELMKNSAVSPRWHQHRSRRAWRFSGDNDGAVGQFARQHRTPDTRVGAHH